MKDKVIYGLNFLWTSIVAFSFPICFELIYLDITGHSKGYGYDLGPDRSVSVFLGCIELLIWLMLALPSHIYIFRKTRRKGRFLFLAHTAWYIALAVLCVFVTGGWAVYLKDVFNL